MVPTGSTVLGSWSCFILIIFEMKKKALVGADRSTMLERCFPIVFFFFLGTSYKRKIFSWQLLVINVDSVIVCWTFTDYCDERVLNLKCLQHQGDWRRNENAEITKKSETNDCVCVLDNELSWLFSLCVKCLLWSTQVTNVEMKMAAVGRYSF